MRFAPRLPRLVAGLPMVACQAALLLTSSSIWAAERATAPATGQGSFRQLTPVPRAAVPRWTDAATLNQPPAGRPTVDPAVQQAAWSNTSSRATNGTAQPPFSTGAPQVRESPPGRKGPMFRGYELNLPSLFGRSKSQPEQATAATAQRMQSRPPVTAQPPQQYQRNVAAMGPAANPSLRSGMTNNRSAEDTNSRPQGYRSYSGQPVHASHSAMVDKASQPGVPPASPPRVPSSTPTLEPMPAAAANAASTAASRSPAVDLAAQAHEWSATAESEADFTRIIETCRRARASKPNPDVVQWLKENTAWALNRRGQLKADAGRTNEAMLDFDDAIRADAKCWRATHNRAVLLAQAGQFEKAFDDFSRTIDIKPDFAKAYSNRAALLVVAGKLQAALADYGRAVELDPNLAIAQRGRGRVCHLLGQLDDAIGHYDAAVQLAPDDAYALASRADLLTDMGRYVDANDDYDRAIQIDARSAHAYSGSAWLLATCPDGSIRHPELAMERAQTAMELSGKKDALCFDTLAAAQASAGDFDAATQTVRQAIDLAPADERDVYRDRLAMYQHARPYRIAPVRPVTQASYEEENN